MTEDFVEIDPFNLDTELIQQPKLYRKESGSLAEARKEVAEAKNLLKLTKAKIRKAIRQNPEAFGITKATESSVDDALEMSVKYQEVQQAVVEAEYKAELLAGSVESYRQRKGSIEGILQLFLAGYYADPKIPKDRQAADHIERLKTEQAFRRNRTR